MMTDYRTKPVSEWTYYVVDHLPTMDNLYRFDTVQEAIEKYKELPETMRSAIGASIYETNELDLIHRCSGNIPVLVTDIQRVSDPVWKTAEIESIVDELIFELGVSHQLDYETFGRNRRSICMELEWHKENTLDFYFNDKQLLIDETMNDSYHLSSINEVYVMGQGWMELKAFLKHLEDSRPINTFDGCKDVFVERINVDYLSKAGFCGQADVSTRTFKMLRAKTIRERNEKISIDDMIQSAGASKAKYSYSAEKMNSKEKGKAF